VDSEAEVGTSAVTTTRYLATYRRLFGTKQFRAFLTESFEEEFPIDDFVTNVQIGRPRNLGAGPGSFDLLITARVLGLRTDFHIAVFRVERVLGVVGATGEPGGRVPLSVMTRLAKIMAARMVTELAPRSTALPTISGSPVVGQTLTATTGTWSQSPTSFAYQWQRCDTAGATCASIAGATGQTYVVAEAGSTIRVSVTARNAAGAATAVSAATAVVSASGAPANTSAPTISGAPQVGQTLTASGGTWTDDPTSFAFQWQRCNAGGTSCVDVAGATAATYVLGTADAGATIRVVVTATNASGSVSAASAATTVVT
jgi:hypothetical protein